MKNINPDPLGVPVYLKTDNEPLPKDKLYYLLTRDGLFLGRNHPFFSSCIPAKTGPGELAEQKSTVTLNYPPIPRDLFQRAVGFFHLVFKAHHWESALILAWNRNTQAMELVCPEQKASGAHVDYTIPTLPHHLSLIGDIHSHCDFSPRCSYTDEEDEMKRPGLHLVVGYIDKEPPTLYAATVVDSHRFELNNPWDLVEDYIQRDTANVPPEWIELVKEKKWEYSSGHYSDYSSYAGGGWFRRKPPPEDRAIIKQVLENFLQHPICPDESEVSRVLFHETKKTSYLYCDKKAAKFIRNWAVNKARYEQTKKPGPAATLAA